MSSESFPTIDNSHSPKDESPENELATAKTMLTILIAQRDKLLKEKNATPGSYNASPIKIADLDHTITETEKNIKDIESKLSSSQKIAA